jgi:hypothetical protein
METQTTQTKSERGAALIFALLSILVLSILAVAIMCTSQEQVWTSLNYRLTAQARYAAEAGVQETMNWLSSASYTAPSTADLASYTMTTNPVTYNGKPVVLSPVSGASNYYDSLNGSTILSGFAAAAAKTLPNENVTYTTTATLLRMTTAGGVAWISGTGGVYQTWQVTSVASIGGIRNATVQVVQTYERTGKPVFQYGLEALGTGCGAITMAGSDSTDSYNSANGTYASQVNPVTGVAGGAGSIATNGGVSLGGSSGSYAQVNGNIASPIPLLGGTPGTTCTNTGGVASTGLIDTDKTAPPKANYVGFSSISAMNPPSPFGCPPGVQPCYPTSPAVITTAQNISTGCAGVTGCTKSATTDKIYDGTATATKAGSTTTTVNDFTLVPGSYGNITINGADVVHVTAGTYTINSINFQQDGQFVVDSGPVVFQIAGNCASGCPTESGIPAAAVGKTGSPVTATEVIYGAGYAGLNGCAPSGGKGVIANPNVYAAGAKYGCGSSQTAFSGIPSNMQIVYGGTNLIRLGGMPNAAVIYAPNGNYYTPGAPVGLYGSVIANTFTDDSGSPFIYDAAEQNAVQQLGNYLPVGGFSWSKF